MLRVLIASGSAATHELLARALRDDPEICVVGWAASGAATLAAAKRLLPHIVMLDMSLEDDDALATTKRLMTEAPLPIIVVSDEADAREAQMSLALRQAGAVGVAPRPTPSARLAEHAGGLGRLAKSMAELKLVRRWPDRPAAARPAAAPSIVPALARALPPARRASGGRNRPRLVAIAASTGGPSALSRILSELPSDFPLPILVVQHISPGFIGGFASWLNGVSALEVKIAEHRERTQPGRVYVATDDRHLGIDEDRRTVLSNAPAIGGFRPSATFLFSSVASAYGADSLCIVLTGMGRDGADGARLAHRNGARILVQDEASSVVFGMPAAVVEDGIADAVLPLSEIAGCLAALTMPA